MDRSYVPLFLSLCEEVAASSVWGWQRNESEVFV